MATGATTNLNLTTVEADDQLPEAVVKANFEVLDQYVAATEMTNKSGSQVTAGDVVVSYTSTDSAFQKTTTASHKQVVGVVQETIADAAAGIVKHYGTSTVKVTGATSRGDWLRTSTTAGKADPVTQTDPPAGAFAIALTSGASTVTAILLSVASASTAALSTGAGTDASAVAPIHYDTTNLYLKVWNGSASVRATLAPTFKYMTAAQVLTTSTTFVDVVTTGAGTMSFTMGANEVWEVQYRIPLTFGGTGGVKFQLTGPAAPTAVSVAGTYPGHSEQTNDSGGSQETSVLAQVPIPLVTAFSSAILSKNSGGATAAGTSDTVTNIANIGGDVIIRAHIQNGSTAGAVTLQVGQNSSNTTTTLGVGSFMRAEKIA